MRRRKKPNHRWKIKHRAHAERKGVGVEDVYWDMTDEKVAVATEKFLDVNIKEELEEIARKVEEEGTKCPECGGCLVYAVASSNPTGVGKTYTQKMKPFTIFYDVVCLKCGLVVRQATHEVHR